MKKAIAVFLTIVMAVTSFPSMVIPVFADETISDEKLFLEYPQYLSNSEMEEGLSSAEEAYRTVMNSYTAADEALSVLMTGMSEGIVPDIKDKLATIGIGESTYEEYVRKCTTKFMKNVMSNESAIHKSSEKVGKAYNTLKASYDITSNVDKTEILLRLTKLAEEHDICISSEGMNKVVNKLYASQDLMDILEIVGDVSNIWIYIMEITELYAIESSTIEFLMEELENANQSGSDLYCGLAVLRNEQEMSVEDYVVKKYVNNKVVDFISNYMVDLMSLGFGVPSTVVDLALAAGKLFSNVVYVNATADELAQTLIQDSFIASIETRLSTYMFNFQHKLATSEDISKFKSLYASYLSAYKTILESCYDISKIEDKYGIGGDCLTWATNIEWSYTYNQYIKWCKSAVAHDIATGELDSESGESTVTDALNEATIKERLDKIMAYKKYTPNTQQRWLDKGSLGFVAFVFNRIFDRKIVARVDNLYNHTLTNTRNLRIIGTLDEDEVTKGSVTELLTSARIGDIILTSGQYEALHAMVVCSAEEDCIEVYDCGTPFNPETAEDQGWSYIQKYKVKYEKLAEACSENGKYMTVPGISLYRAVRKINNENSGDTLYHEGYDDSKNYVIENGVLTKYKGRKKELEIPEGVTSIADECFSYSDIRTVTMPNTVTKIGLDAFRECSRLEYVKFSSGLKQISSRAFYGCTSLTNVILPQSLTDIDAYAFSNSALVSANIPSGVEAVDWYAFYGCTNLSTAVIGSNVMLLGTNIFADCPNLSMVYWNTSRTGFFGGSDIVDSIFANAGENVGGFDVVISEGVTRIPANAFRSSEYLKSVTIPDSVTRIDTGAFSWCSITSITIPENVQYIGEDAFFGCKKLKSVYWNARNVMDLDFTPFSEGYYSEDSPEMKVIFGDTVEYIPAFALSGCEQITEIHIGSNVKSIGDNAFQFTGIKKLVIPDNVENCGFGAIWYCEKLTDLTVSTNMDADDMDGASGLSSLMSISVSESSPYLEVDENVLYNKGKTTLVCIPMGRESFTIDKNCKSISWVVDEMQYENIREIAVEDGNKYFSSIDGNLYNKNKTKLVRYASGKADTSFTVPSHVTSIGKRAFSYSNNLRNVSIQDTVTEIEEGIFARCDNIQNVSFPKGLTEIPDSIFMSSGIEEIVIPDGVYTIGSRAFYSCKKLKSVTIPATVADIYYDAFKRCDSIADVYYGAGPGRWAKIVLSDGNEALTDATIHYTLDFDEEKVPGLMRYKNDPDAYLIPFDEIVAEHYNIGRKTYISAYSNDYPGKLALMDATDGKLILDNLDILGRLSEHSSLIYTNLGDRKVVYNLITKSVVCELANFDGLRYSGRFNEDGGFVNLASDNKLHFITNDGVIGNAVNLDHSIYDDGNVRLHVQNYLGNGLWWLTVGNDDTYTQSIGAVNAEGEIVAYFDEASASYYENKLLVVKIGGKYGAIDKTGALVIPAEYNNINCYEDNVYVAIKDGIYYEIDAFGNIVNSLSPDTALYDGISGYIDGGLFKVYKRGENYTSLYGVVNFDNEIVLPISYRSVYIRWYEKENNMLCLSIVGTDSYDQKDGCVDTNGIVIPFVYNSIRVFHDGLSLVYNNGKFGFIDLNGNVVIPFEYDYGEDFSENLAAVQKNGKYGYIDREGNTFIPFEYDSASSFEDGKAWVYKEEDGVSIQIDKQNNPVGNVSYEGEYSLTGDIDWFEYKYIGGLRKNSTGEVVDISHLNVLPLVFGENNQYIMGFTADMSKAYRIVPAELGFSEDEAVEISEFSAMDNIVTVSINDLTKEHNVYVAAYASDGSVLEVIPLTLTAGTAKHEFSSDGIKKYKLFVWNKNLVPAVNAPEIVLEQQKQ